MWILYAIIASILWGFDYSLTEKVLEKISLPTLLSIELFCGFVGMVALGIASGSFRADLPALVASKRLVIFVALIVVLFNVANSLIVLSIETKNATLSGLIEISYPLFIVLSSWLLFGENNLNIGSALGGALVFVGVLLIYLFNR